MTLTTRAETLLQEALTLPAEERVEIAGVLLEILGPAPEADVKAAWRQEVAAPVAASEDMYLGGRAMPECLREAVRCLALAGAFACAGSGALRAQHGNGIWQRRLPLP